LVIELLGKENQLKKSLGILTTRKKSLTFKPKPKPSMMRARAIGAIFVAISIKQITLLFQIFKH
jgi:hypothetical protein